MNLRRIEGDLWEIPREGRMKVPGRVYSVGPPAPDDPSLQQVANVAHLPGILRFSLAMPDIHWGYGFPIGGVAAMDAERGAVSPGGVGYDINCGVRVVTTAPRGGDGPRAPARGRRAALPRHPDRRRRVGARSRASRTRSSTTCSSQGARWAVRRGFAAASDDAERCEEGGRLAAADPSAVSARARLRGVRPARHARERQPLPRGGPGRRGLRRGRGGGVRARPRDGRAADPLRLARPRVPGLRRVPRRRSRPRRRRSARTTRRSRTASSPAPRSESDEGRRYLGAMQAAANFAWANRQVMTGLAVRALLHALPVSERELGARLLYDVCHNVAKLEEHEVDGVRRRVLVHRKGATRCFGPGDPRVPAPYREVGQPVLIPGDMGRYSYVLAGTERAMRDTFGSSCHGAGPAPLARRGAAARARPLHRARARGEGDRGHLARQEDARRGDERGLQGRRAGGRGDARRRHLAARRAARADGRREGLTPRGVRRRRRAPLRPDRRTTASPDRTTPPGPLPVRAPPPSAHVR